MPAGGLRARPAGKGIGFLGAVLHPLLFRYTLPLRASVCSELSVKVSVANVFPSVTHTGRAERCLLLGLRCASVKVKDCDAEERRHRESASVGTEKPSSFQSLLRNN